MNTKNIDLKYQRINLLKNIEINSLISIGLIFLFLITEKPSILYRLSGIQASDLSFFVKLFFYSCILAIWAVALTAVYFVARSRLIFKWGVFFLIIIPIFVFDVFFSVSGTTLLYSDYLGLRLAVANTQDALSEYGKFLFYPFIRSVLLLAAFLIVSPSSMKKAEVKASLLLFLSVFIFVGVCFAKKGTATDKIPGFLSVYGFEVTMLLDQTKHSHYNHDGILFEPRSKPRRENILLIIDESVRYDFVNGEESNSVLRLKSNSKWNIYDYGSATSGNNCSAESNVILRKGPKPEHLGAEIQENPLIWSYAKKAGFKTTLIDAQRGGQGHDYFDKEELKMIDNNIITSDYESDRDIAKELSKLLKSAGNFVIIIKKGPHFPYSNRYPKSFAPSFKSNYINEKQNRIEYARAIMYQTGGFFEELFSESIKPSTLMIYTSDHGQNLEDKVGATHCTATGNPYQGEGMVPMLVIDNKNNEQISSYSQINHNKTSHFNIFSTLLYYLGYEQNDYLNHYGNSLIEPVNRLGYFSYGSAFGSFGSKPTIKFTSETLDYSGVKKRF
jgi:glucan phosphoethanolaminetransferase (alkaline phosphatase superfamily)